MPVPFLLMRGSYCLYHVPLLTGLAGMGSDGLLLFYPAEHYLAESLRAGTLPFARSVLPDHLPSPLDRASVGSAERSRLELVSYQPTSTELTVEAREGPVILVLTATSTSRSGTGSPSPGGAHGCAGSEGGRGGGEHHPVRTES